MKTKKAKIIKCSFNHYWYRDKIGKIVEVKELDRSSNKYCEAVKLDGEDYYGYTILKKDIEIID
jgi:hypothetical protein